MDLIIAFIIFSGSMIFVLFNNFSMIWSMIIGFFVFAMTGMRHGFKIREILKMSISGANNSLIVVRVMLTIGILTGLWRSAGTFAILTAWGLKIITPKFFILASFILSCILSYALGTSFGTVGTLGIALMTLARTGGVNEILTAGAIMSGIHFGDRGSPASSCAHLVTSLTETDFYKNIRIMMFTAILPLIISLIFYFFLSLKNPLINFDSSISEELSKSFNLNPIVISPAILMLILPLLKINIFYAFLVSIITAFLCTIFFQGETFLNTLNFAIFGFYSKDGIRVLFNGGGLISMISISFVLLISGTYSGIFEGTEMLQNFQVYIKKLINKIGFFPSTFLTGLLSDGIFCNQTVGVMMTSQLMKEIYKNQKISKTELAIDISNSAVIIAPIIPWCIACSVPITMMRVNNKIIIYSFYLYLVPLCYFITKNNWRKIMK